MATLTIRNLPQEAHDALRRLAADNRNSMEAEARAALLAHVARKRSRSDVNGRVRQLRARLPSPPQGAKADGVDAFLAAKRIELLFEEGLIGLEDKRAWDERIDRFDVSLEDVQAYFDQLWPWSKPPR